jgi:hypothetical protein
LFLSKAELDYLTANRQFSEDYRYTIKSRLQKKVQQFTREELPLLVEQGYLDLTEFCKVELTENCKVSNALVAQPGRELPTYEIEHKLMKKESLGGDLDPRPLPYQGNALPG